MIELSNHQRNTLIHVMIISCVVLLRRTNYAISAVAILIIQTKSWSSTREIWGMLVRSHRKLVFRLLQRMVIIDTDCPPKGSTWLWQVLSLLLLVVHWCWLILTPPILLNQEKSQSIRLLWITLMVRGYLRIKFASFRSSIKPRTSQK